MHNLYLLLIASLFVTSCSSGAKQIEKSSTPFNEGFTSQTKTVKAAADKQIREITFAGKVTTNPDKTVNYIPLMSGIVTRTYFSLGEKIKKGQPMLDIRSVELSALQSELISLETEYEAAQRERRSAEIMFEDNMISERELLAVKGQERQAQAAYEKAKNDINVFGINKGEGLFTIIAPSDGYVISKNCSSGSTVSSDGESIFSVADLSEVWVEANVYAGNLQFVHEGMETLISSVSYPDHVFHGKIDLISQVFDPEDRSIKARIVLDNNDLRLKPEMSVVVKMRNKTLNERISLPSEAVIFDNDSYFVIVKNDGDFSIREVTPMGHHSGETYLTGVNLNEDIVCRNQLLIYNELKGK